VSLSLHNPHSVLAVLETRPQDVVEIRLGDRRPRGAWREVASRAAAQNIPIGSASHNAGSQQRKQGKQGRNRKQDTSAGRTAASFASVRPRNDVSLNDLFAPAAEAQEHRLFLALDCLQDPHNVGAVFRTAAFFGVSGIVATKNRSAPLNATVYDVASGGLEYVPFSVQTNLSRTLSVAQKAGLWVLGTSEHAETDFRDVPRDRSWLLVLGNEEQGLRRLTAEKCDTLCRITPQSFVRSLNVSVAAGILIGHFAGA